MKKLLRVVRKSFFVRWGKDLFSAPMSLGYSFGVSFLVVPINYFGDSIKSGLLSQEMVNYLDMSI